MSPASPSPYDNQSRSSTDNNRLRSLEAQSAIHATEVALLRQMTDDFGSWRYRVDSASVQTAHVLEALNKDFQSLKTHITDLEEDVHSFKNANTVFDQLKKVECQLSATRSLFENQDNINAVINSAILDLRSTVDASHEVADASSLTATTALHHSESLSSQVQALKLGLEVVEQSLEGLDVSEILSSIKSRMEDMDIGMEKIAHEAFANVSALESSFAVTKAIAERADITSAETAKTVSSLTNDVADIRHELQRQKQQLRKQQEQQQQQSGESFVTPPSSVTSSPSRLGASSTDPRLKAAVHTLTDGYRSLHRAMTLAYEEQSDMQVRVHEVANAASVLETKYQDKKKAEIYGTVVSHPLDDKSMGQDDDDEDEGDVPEGRFVGVGVAEEFLVEMKALLAAQAAESVYQSRRADFLEVQLRDMRRLLMSLAPTEVQRDEGVEDSDVAGVSVEKTVAVLGMPKRDAAADDGACSVRFIWDAAGESVVLHIEQRDEMIAAVY